jgi:hypothetical protein
MSFATKRGTKVGHDLKLLGDKLRNGNSVLAHTLRHALAVNYLRPAGMFFTSNASSGTRVWRCTNRYWQSLTGGQGGVSIKIR